MADTNTLQHPQPKQERLNPSQVIGGTFEDIFETITGTGTGYVHEAQVMEGQGIPKDLENLASTSEFKTKFPTSGEITGFQKAKALEAAEEIISVHRQEQMQNPLTQKRIEVNSAIGIRNVLYEDTVNSDGSLRVDVQVEMDKKNSEIAEAELKAKREAQLVQARGKATPGFQVGENELLKGGENQSHFTKAVG